MEVKTRISPPALPERPPTIPTPDLLKNLNLETKQKSVKFKCKPGYICFSKVLSSDAEPEDYQSLHKDLSIDSNEVELPMSSLSKDDSIDSHIAEENEKMFKNGIYAHWLMKADLETEA